MSATNSGGPAFPVVTTPDTVTSGSWSSSPGMTLRDYFAAMALSGLCANPGGPFQASAAYGWSITNCNESDVARTAYALADAMLSLPPA